VYEDLHMTPKVEFHFDFGSPNAYFAHKVIPKVEQRTGVKFQYVPILLGGVFKLANNASPIVAFKDTKAKLDYMKIESRRFVKKHGLTAFKMNPNFPVNTVQIMRGAVAAASGPSFQRYVEAVFQAMWEQEKKMDDAEVIRATLDAAGLDGQDTLARIQEPAVKDTLLKNTESSVARGTFGAPTFYVGDEIFFGKDSLGAVEEEIAATRA
jgi:2-hydroxychromene-2-carboxylate isomerase